MFLPIISFFLLLYKTFSETVIQPGIFIEGFLQSKTSYNYYSISFLDNLKRIYFDYESRYATLYINQKSRGNPTSSNYQFKISSTQRELLLLAQDIKKNTFNGETLLIGVSTSVDYSSEYRFKISKQYASGPIIRTVTTDEEVNCEYNIDDVCYLMFDLETVAPSSLCALDS